jgi:hypothetical protein
MPQLVSDDFNRANNASLGVNWTQDRKTTAAIGVTSNQAAMTGGSDFAMDWWANWSGAGGTDDQYSELTLPFLQASGNDTGPIVRASGNPVSGTGKAYLFVLNDNDAAHSMGDTTWSVALYKVIDDAFTQIGSSVTNVTISANDTIRLEVNGTNLTGKINGATIITGSDSAVTTGAPGMYISSGSATVWDNFAAGSLAVADLVALIGEPITGSSQIEGGLR